MKITVEGIIWAIASLAWMGQAIVNIFKGESAILPIIAMMGATILMKLSGREV